MGVHRRRSWHVTTFPVIVAGFGLLALAIGLMFGGLHSGDPKPADAQVGQPTATSTLPSATTVDDSLTSADLPSSADASHGTATTTRTPTGSARPTPHPTAGATPRRSPTPTPSGDGSSNGSGGIQLPTVKLPTFG
ncbi:hypothetical protein I6A60_35595 [Frankia sp. AgB1.9]|uniref:hypothetical protein n=1 Tax=unclassified Frankia TaxID=2632575 RepID=UPI0019333BBD|nr:MULTISPECIES: hypothetical protein [unclassified Frankia]MBL7494523.1 hypothetical protein [Frankia sp. AgW1.1]MBL7553137.1 hypothetical protein [Frankia sp. AgB1.9]MBL7618147.1 hypothetical protein [Frankia sp. AgB1.8]